MNVGKLLGDAARAIIGGLTGGLSERIIGIVENVAGVGLPPETRAQLSLQIERETSQRAQAAFQAASEAERNLTERIRELEGSAKDLLQAGGLGRVVLFVRGAQRPAWGVGLIYCDFMVFSQRWPLVPDSATESAFWVINLLVLGFLFGERTVQNVMPMMTTFRQAKNGNG